MKTALEAIIEAHINGSIKDQDSALRLCEKALKNAKSIAVIA
jgi:hypothetical protein